MLCSGGPGCCDYLAPVAAMLEGLATVIRFEPRGCGRSEKVDTYSVATSPADLEAVRQHFNLDKWLVVGHSWGADLHSSTRCVTLSASWGLSASRVGAFTTTVNGAASTSRSETQDSSRPLTLTILPT